MSNEEPALATRRTPRQGAGGSPVGSTLSIVLAIVAVVAGFLILRNITDDGTAASGPGVDVPSGDATATTVLGDTDGDGVADIDVIVTTTTTTTTTVPLVTTGATVIVANANSVGGSAGAMTTALEFAGFTLTDPTNATGPDVADSVVYFDPGVAGAIDVANSVARVMGGLSVLELQTPAPTESGSANGAGVLVLLGDNEAGQTLEDLQAAAEPVAAETAEAPAVAGDDTATTVAPADE